MAGKDPGAFRTISEAASEVGVAAHSLRTWEARLSVLRPMRRAGGRRFYRPEDIRLLLALKTLLQGEKRSISEFVGLSRAAIFLAASGVSPCRVKSETVLASLSEALAAVVAARERLDRVLPPP